MFTNRDAVIELVRERRTSRQLALRRRLLLAVALERPTEVAVDVNAFLV